MYEVIAHPKSNFDQERTIVEKVRIEIDHFVVLKCDSVVGPPCSKRAFLPPRHLSTVAEKAGRPAKFSISFQIRHFTEAKRCVF
mgnify:CR=1 FL=1